MSETRIPTQKRSLEKRKKIIEKGFELMCEQGYYNTSTNDIAAYSEVSVGIIYQYFNDKKEIFLEGVKNYANQIMFPMLSVLEKQNINLTHLDELIKTMIQKFIEVHTISKRAHEELMAMSHLDEDIANIFKESELQMTNKIVTLLENNHVHLENSKEKIHIILGLIDTLCHEIVYHKHETINYDIMIEENVSIIVHLLQTKKES